MRLKFLLLVGLIAVVALAGFFFGRSGVRTDAAFVSSANRPGEALGPGTVNESAPQIVNGAEHSHSMPGLPTYVRRNDLEYIKSLQVAEASVSVRLFNPDKTLSLQLQKYLELSDEEVIGLQDALSKAKAEVGRIASQNLVVLEADSRAISVMIPAASEAERASLFGLTVDTLDASIGQGKTDRLIAVGFEELFSYLNQFWAYDTPYRIQKGGVGATESYPLLLAAPTIDTRGRMTGGNFVPFSVLGDLESERRLTQYPWTKKIWGEINRLIGN
jgi:hypothetical protein